MSSALPIKHLGWCFTWFLHDPHPQYFSPHMKQLSNSLNSLTLFSLLFFLSPAVFLNSPWSPPSHTQPVNGYAATPISSTNTDVVPDVANTLSPFGLSHLETNCWLRWSVHPQRNPSRHSWAPTGSPCSPKYPYNPSPPTTHPLSIHWPT